MIDLVAIFELSCMQPSAEYAPPNAHVSALLAVADWIRCEAAALPSICNRRCGKRESKIERLVKPSLEEAALVMTLNHRGNPLSSRINSSSQQRSISLTPCAYSSMSVTDLMNLAAN